MNTICQLPWIAYKSGIDIEVGNVYIGSFSLQRLVGMNERSETCTMRYFKDGTWTTYTGKSFSQVFAYTDWDFISVQRSASDDEIWLMTQNEADTEQNSMTNINYNTALPAVYMSHNEALQYVLNLIRDNVTNKECEVIFNSSFADPSEGITDTQTGVIISTAKDMKAQFGIDFFATAIAVRNARNTFLRHIGSYNSSSNANANQQLCYDSQHLDYGIGCYVASICLLEFVCRKLGWSVINMNGYGTQEEVGANWWVTITNDNYTAPTEETMMVAKACAMCACDTPDTVSTKLQDRFKWKITYSLESGITASNSKVYCGNEDTYKTTLSGTVSSVVIISSPWDRNQSASTLVQGTDYTYDSSTGEIIISSVEGDIVITAS